jgi:CheY-like chemotaxis protein
MNETSICVMLVDDNPDDNFFHEREIKQNNPNNVVLTKNSVVDALEHLKSTGPGPDLILLDINMPGMNGWEFLEEYQKLDDNSGRRPIIIMLTTSENPDDEAKAKGWAVVSDYISKPLTEEIMKGIIGKYFSGKKKNGP